MDRKTFIILFDHEHYSYNSCEYLASRDKFEFKTHHKEICAFEVRDILRVFPENYKRKKNLIHQNNLKDFGLKIV